MSLCIEPWKSVLFAVVYSTYCILSQCIFQAQQGDVIRRKDPPMFDGWCASRKAEPDHEWCGAEPRLLRLLIRSINKFPRRHHSLNTA